MADSEPFLFISHVSEDRAAAMDIVAELERRGIPCWIAPRNIEPGQPFDDAIVSALERCQAMLLIFSDQCNESEYIRREVTVAGETQKVVIPLRIEDAQPRRGLRVRLSDLHWLDAFAAREQAIEELARRFAPATTLRQGQRPQPPVSPAASSVLAETTPAPNGAPVALPRSDAVSAPSATSHRTMIAAAAVTVVILGAGLWFWTGGVWTGGDTRPKPASVVAPASAPAAPPPSPPQTASVAAPAPAPAPAAGAAAEALSRGKAAFERKDYADAVRWNREAAEQGNATAETYIGYFYENGLGVPQDYSEALRWYRKAAEQGHAPAQKNIGTLYEQGLGVPRDYGEAMRWYRMAAERGHAGAETNIGYLYENGLGVAQNYAEALRWYRISAEQGEATAQNNIGVFYEKGYGVAQDYAEALRWYRMAAERGNIDAEYNLGLLYAEGRGIGRDLAEARQWMSKAAEVGDPEAKKWLAAHPE